MTTPEDTPVSGQLTATDPDGDPLTYTPQTPPSHGSVVVNPDGSWTYTPSTDYTGTDSFTVVVHDGQGGTDTLVVDVNVVPEPTIVVDDVDGSVSPADNSVLEASGDTVTGAITERAPAGVDTLTINGVDITGASPTTPVVIPGSEGTLTITDYDPVTGAITYSYTEDGAPETHNATNDNVLDSFAVVVVDQAGQSSTNTLDIQILDDVPAAVADTATVAEGGTVSGNVVTDVAGADTLGADGAALGGPVTAVNGGTGNVGTAVAGSYGSLTLNADGSYSYQSTPNSVPAGQTATDVFQYTITDGDGDTSTVTLTISIPDGAITTQVDTGVSDLTVDEAALASGSNPSSPDETATGQLSTSGGTGPYSYTGGGSSALGTLTVNPDGSYSYTLNVPTTDLAGDETDSFTYTVTDALGNTATQTITITIVDDVPAAVADTATVAEGGTVSGNVVTDVAGADTLGADGAALGGPVTAVNGGTGNVGTAVAGSYGSLTLNADGSYSYQSTPNSVPAGQTATDVFQYTITDGDGDTSTVTLTISIPDGAITTQVDTGVSDLTVDEAALASGSNPSSPDETATGQLSTSGGTGPYSYTGGGSSALGTLTVNPDGSYSYTLNVPTTDLAGDETDSFTYTVTDALGNTATQTITITIVDDVPAAVADTTSITEDATPNAVTGNVRTNDTQGADGATVTAVSPTLSYGSLSLAADGSYTYTLDNNNAAVNALATGQSLTDTYIYTLTDADGDTSTATLTITITGAYDLAQTVSEEGLSGSVPDTTGNPIDTTNVSTSAPEALPLDVTGATGPSGLTSGGQLVTWSTTSTASGLVLTGELPNGDDVMRVVFDNTANTYTVELLKPLDHATANGENLLTFGVALTTASGPMNLQITVEDDSPTSDTSMVDDVVSGGDTNVMIIFDLSGSMSNPDGRFSAAKTAARNILDTYDASGETRVRLVTFSDEARAIGSVWMTVADAKAAINSWSATGGTNYDAALAVAMDAFDSPGRLEGGLNHSYFLTDGEPSLGDGASSVLQPLSSSAVGDVGIGATEEATWKSFLTANEIKSQALAFASTFDPTTGLPKINPIAYDGSTATELSGIHVPNANDLSSVLTTLAQQAVTGTLPGTIGVDAATGTPETVSLGADGGYVKSIDIFTATFTYNPPSAATGGLATVTKTGGIGLLLTYSLDQTTNVLTIDDVFNHKQLKINIVTGAYSFVAPADTVTIADFGLIDKDGDVGTVNLTMTVTADPSADGVATLGAFVSEEGLAGGYADTAGIYGDYTNAATSTGSTTYVVDSITGPSGLTSGGVAVVWSSSLVGGVLTMTGTAGAGGPTVMTVQLDNSTGSYTVNLLQGLDHNPNYAETSLNLIFGLTGTNAGNAIQTELHVRVEDDMPWGSLILGTGANDVLSGDANANLIVGGPGADNMTGGGGADTFAWFKTDHGGWSGASAKIDRITDFNLGTFDITATGATAADRLNITQLLNQPVSGAAHNYINIEKSGSDVLVHISNAGGFTGGVYNATNANVHITLVGVAGGFTGTTNDDFITQLLTNGQLVWI